MGKPAILNMRRATSLRHGQRTVKMLRPVCPVCNDGDNVPQDWYKSCTHDPYMAVAEKRIPTTLYEAILDAEGNPTGEKRVVGQEQRAEFKPAPNWVEVALTLQVNSGRGVEVGKARKGYIEPHELRTELYPDGIAPCCQFRGCYAQLTPAGKPLLRTRYGDFCREVEARLVGFAERGQGALEVGWNQGSIARRNSQLDEVAIY